MPKLTKLLLKLFLGILIVNIMGLPLDAATTYPDVFAESAVLIDAKTGQVLYGKSETSRQYPASITKLMTALVAIENQKPTDKITMSKEAVFSIERGSSHIGLDVNEEINLDQALHALLLASANESANGIAELCDGSIAAFAEHCTRRAKELGALNTNFMNPHGLHDPQHYTTAYDMALIAKELIKQPYFIEIMDTKTYQIPPTNRTDEIRYLSQPHKLMHQRRYSKTYREDVIGGKTGFTTKAGNTLVTMAKRGDVELIAVVLKSNRANLYSDTNMLLDYGFENYKSISLHQQDNTIASIPIYTIKSGQLIHVADCDVCVEECVNFLASSTIKERMIDSTVSLPPRLDKDVAVGDVIGTISYGYKGDSLSKSNLVVQRLNYLPAPEPAILPQKPSYTIPTFVLTTSPSTASLTYLALVGILGVLASLSILILKYQHRNKLYKKNKKILRFSKTIK